jgi:hypothetical protein
MDILGNVFPKIGENKIIFFDGGTMEETTIITNNLNAGDYTNRYLYDAKYDNSGDYRVQGI